MTPDEGGSNNRWVVVTGASSGIGYDIALSLQQHGYQVIATARSTEDLAMLQRFGLVALHLELSDEESVTRAIMQINQICDHQLHGLVNNAAYGQPGAVEDISRKALEQQFAVNLFGTHQLTCGLLPALHRGKTGRIVNISSVLGLVAFPWQGAYNASKYALEGLSDTLRLELRGTTVHLSLVEPGPIHSQFRANALHAFDTAVDWQHSSHSANYSRIKSYYAASSHPTPFTAAPRQVTRRVLHALHSPRPQPRYYVTLPTYILATCRRVLPYRLLDRLLSQLGSMR